MPAFVTQEKKDPQCVKLSCYSEPPSDISKPGAGRPGSIFFNYQRSLLDFLIESRVSCQQNELLSQNFFSKSCRRRHDSVFQVDQMSSLKKPWRWYLGVGEMARPLGVLAALAEDQGWIPNTHIRWLTTVCDSSSKGSDIGHLLLVSLRAHTHTPTHK